MESEKEENKELIDVKGVKVKKEYKINKKKVEEGVVDKVEEKEKKEKIEDKKKEDVGV